MKGKYIIIKRHGIETPILFDGVLYHSDFERPGIVSAGFFMIDDKGKIHCYGKSVTLNIKSRNEIDTLIVQTWMKHIQDPMW